MPRGSVLNKCSASLFFPLTWVHHMGFCHDKCPQFELPLKCSGSHVFDKIKHIRKTVPLVEVPCHSHIPRLLITERISSCWRCNVSEILIWTSAWLLFPPPSPVSYSVSCVVFVMQSFFYFFYFLMVITGVLQDIKHYEWCKTNKNKPTRGNPSVSEGPCNHTGALLVTSILCNHKSCGSNTKIICLKLHLHKYILVSGLISVNHSNKYTASQPQL